MNEFMSLFHFHDRLQKKSIKAAGSFSKYNNLQNPKKTQQTNSKPSSMVV